jgi:integrase
VWRFKYHFADKREKLTIGRYPEIGLARARELRDEAAALLAEGRSPAKEKQANKITQRIDSARAFTFGKLAEQWFDEDISSKSENWQYNVRNWLKLDIYPDLAELDPRSITEDHIEAVLAKIIKRGAPNSANKVRTICSHIFDFGKRKREVNGNPAAQLAPIKTPETQSHRALTVREIKPFLEALDADNGRLISKIAIELLMLTLTRKDELRLAKWPEFDLENGVWEIPAHRMKMRDPHRVYLSRQAGDLLQKLKPFSREDGFILPSNYTLSKPMGHTTINSVIDRLEINGTRFVPHGLRATASSILNEANFRYDVIERQLAHRDRNKVRSIYNQAEYAHERREMLQWWADYVDSLKRGSNVVPINARRLNNA